MIQVGITERGDAAINKGWLKWVTNGQPCILITKNIKSLIEENKNLFFGQNLKGNIIAHATITGLGHTVFEPNVPKTDDMLSYLEYCLKSPSFNKDRLVIRLDPIIIPLALQNQFYKDNILKIAAFAKKYNLRLRISFFDYYPHVRQRIEHLLCTVDPLSKTYSELQFLSRAQPNLHLDLIERTAFLELLKERTGISDIEICGEPGMPCTGCLSQKDLDIFGISLEDEIEKGFQRPACACLGLKRELLDNKHPCKHKCIYCYWKDN